jgi:hypothetical protein
MKNWKNALLATWVTLLVLVYAVSFLAPAVGLFHDDGIYTVTAKALAEGKGYRIISLPEEIPQTKYPPLFPLLLTALWKLNPSFPGNVYWLKLVPMAAAGLWLWLSYKLLERELGSSRVAAVLTLIAASSFWTVYLSATLLSETLFAALTTGCLLLLRRCEEGPDDGRRLFWSAALAAGAVLTRTIGVCLVLAGVLALFGRRRFLRGLMFLAYSAAMTAPWFVWVYLQRGSGSTGAGYYTLANYTNWNIVLNYDWAQKATVLFVNALHLLLTLAWPLGFASPPPLWTLLLLGLLLMVGIVSYPLKQASSLLLYYILYLGVVLAWAWPPARFLAVIYPLSLLFLWRPIALLLKAGFLDRLRSDWIALVAVACLAVSAGWRLPCNAMSAARTGHVRMTAETVYDWGDFISITSWIRTATPQSAILMGNIDPLLFLYTGRKAVRPFQAQPLALFYTTGVKTSPLGSPCDLGEGIRSSGTTHLVVTSTGDYSEEPFFDRLREEFDRSHPGVLSPVYHGSRPGFAVYSVDRNKLLASSALAACR